MISETFYFNNQLNDIYVAFINRMNPLNKGVEYLMDTNEINNLSQKLEYRDWRINKTDHL